MVKCPKLECINRAGIEWCRTYTIIVFSGQVYLMTRFKWPSVLFHILVYYITVSHYYENVPTPYFPPKNNEFQVVIISGQVYSMTRFKWPSMVYIGTVLFITIWNPLPFLTKNYEFQMAIGIVIWGLCNVLGSGQ